MFEKVSYEEMVQTIKEVEKTGFVGITCVRKTDGAMWIWTKDPQRIGTFDKKGRGLDQSGQNVSSGSKT